MKDKIELAHFCSSWAPVLSSDPMKLLSQTAVLSVYPAKQDPRPNIPLSVLRASSEADGESFLFRVFLFSCFRD